MKIGCWAADLGDCDGKLSGEHVVSAALWTGPALTVEGGPWGTPRELGVASLTAKILCRRHNSRLSELDEQGAHAFETIAAGIALSNARERLPGQPWMRHGFTVDGPRLERWFFKTAINIAIFLKSQPLWLLDRSRGRPPRDLVEMVFGLRPISHPFGLYVAAAVGDSIVSQEEVRCHLLNASDDAIAGAMFLFRGFEFVVNLTPIRADGILSKSGTDLLRSREHLLYHLARINSDVNGYRSHFLDFSWPGSRFNHFAP